jgi:hypothetical protein
MPIATVEVAEPVVLATKVVDMAHCHFTPCCVCACDCIPENVCACVGGNLCDTGERNLYVALGFFSIVRIERPAQYLVNAVEYCVPEKECRAPVDDNPCTLFKNMSFPVNEFCSPSFPPRCKDDDKPKKCGCD